MNSEENLPNDCPRLYKPFLQSLYLTASSSIVPAMLLPTKIEAASNDFLVSSSLADRVQDVADTGDLGG